MQFFVSPKVQSYIGNADELRQLYDYWTRAAGAADLPGEPDIDLGNLAEIRDNIMYLQAVDGGRDFIYLHYGRAIARVYGHDMTGKPLSKLQVIALARYIRTYREIVESREPRYSLHRAETTLDSGASNICWERLMLPVVNAENLVSRILCVNCSRPWDYRADLYDSDDKDMKRRA